jgi:hypothetical protein
MSETKTYTNHLVAELRALAGSSNPKPWTARLATSAADEIERLVAAERTAVEALGTEIARRNRGTAWWERG